MWYHRVDLGRQWDRVREKWNRWFEVDREKGGLQCKLYRILDDHGVPRMREQNRASQRRGSDVEYIWRVNFMDFFDVRYPWMLLEHRGQL